MKLFEPQPFQFKHMRRGDDGPWRSYAVFTCGRCGAERTEATDPAHFSPQHLVKRAKTNGWVCAVGRSAAICPSCANIPKEPAVAANPAPQAAASSNVAALRSPTQDQRLAIRGALDNHFDDKLGRYLGGYTDDKIAEHIGVPRVFVTHIREAAYGPLLGNPALDAAQAQLDAVAESVVTLRRHMEIELAKLNADMDKARGAITKAAAAP